MKKQCKHLIWDNDVCSMYDALVKEREYDKTVDDSFIWNEAWQAVDDYLDDEVSNLDLNLPGDIVLCGILQRWNGSYFAYANLNTRNLGEALKKAIERFGWDNSFEIYTKGSKMCISQTGHDNPTNPSIMEFRMLKPGKELYGKTRYILMNSEPLAVKCKEVYGW